MISGETGPLTCRRGAVAAVIVLVAVLLVLLGAAPALAATVHVATNGSDAAGDGSAAAPYRTVGKGLAEASSGDTVQVGAGTYSSATGEAFPTSLKGGVTLRGAGAGVTTIQGQAGADVLVLSAEGTARVAGMTVTGGARGLGTEWAGTLVVEGCAVSGCEIGVGVLGSAASITDSTIEGNAGDGVYTNNAASEVAISRCVIQDNAGVGVSLFFSDIRLERNLIRRNASGVYGFDGGGATLVNNVVAGNRDRGVYTGVKGFARMTNDTIADNGGGGVVVNAMSGAHMKNVIVWGNATGVTFESDFNAAADASHSCIQGAMTGTGNIAASPSFASDGTYRLDPGSPCIDAGTNDGAPDVDRDGTPRPYDGDGDGVAVADMGAYEWANLVFPGTNVSMQLRGVRVTFARVLTTGTVSVATTRAPASRGANFRVRAGQAYMISAGCSYVGPVTVTAPIGRAKLPARAIALYQAVGRGWKNITTSVDTRRRTVTGVAARL